MNRIRNFVFIGLPLAICLAVAIVAIPRPASAWNEDQFERRPLFAYPLPLGHDNIVGNLLVYQIQKTDTLLDVGRWFGLSSVEISNANNHMDWWTPSVGTKIVLPGEHILPDAPRTGIVLNIPEMRLYYYPLLRDFPNRKSKITPAAFKADNRSHENGTGRTGAQVVYTFPVGLGRFDWKTPIGNWRVRGKTKEPTWVVPEDIYEEHLERDGEAEHVVRGGDPDNPLGHYRIELTLTEYAMHGTKYAMHGTNVPWGVGMEVSHGCIRLYMEDIERLFRKVKIGTPGAFVYQPVKFGWRGDALYVEVHDDLYGRYPGLYAHSLKEVERLGIQNQVDMSKLRKAVEEKTGVPTYVMPGAPPDASASR